MWLPHADLVPSWLLDVPNGYMTTSDPAFDGQLVSALMNEQHSDWDRDIIKDLFNKGDENLIIQVPVIECSSDDEWYWIYDANGKYTVKTAYCRIRYGDDMLSDNFSKRFWVGLWNCKVPAKVKHTIWRACINILPTNLALRAKGVPMSATCPMCHCSAESITHVLIDCYLQSHAGAYCCSVRWNENITNHALVLYWAIWKSRNGLLWNKMQTTPSTTTMHANYTLTQWSNAQQNILQPLTLPTHGSSERWIKPTNHTVKVNLDAAVFHPKDMIGLGGLARNCEGQVLGVFQRSKFGV